MLSMAELSLKLRDARQHTQRMSELDARKKLLGNPSCSQIELSIATQSSDQHDDGTMMKLCAPVKDDLATLCGAVRCAGNPGYPQPQPCEDLRLYL